MSCRSPGSTATDLSLYDGEHESTEEPCDYSPPAAVDDDWKWGTTLAIVGSAVVLVTLVAVAHSVCKKKRLRSIPRGALELGSPKRYDAVGTGASPWDA